MSKLEAAECRVLSDILKRIPISSYSGETVEHGAHIPEWAWARMMWDCLLGLRHCLGFCPSGVERFSVL